MASTPSPPTPCGPRRARQWRRRSRGTSSKTDAFTPGATRSATCPPALDGGEIRGRGSGGGDARWPARDDGSTRFDPAEARAPDGRSRRGAGPSQLGPPRVDSDGEAHHRLLLGAEEAPHLVVIEGEPRGPEATGVGGQRSPSGADARIELGCAVAATGRGTEALRPLALGGYLLGAGERGSEPGLLRLREEMLAHRGWRARLLERLRSRGAGCSLAVSRCKQRHSCLSGRLDAEYPGHLCVHEPGEQPRAGIGRQGEQVGQHRAGIPEDVTPAACAVLPGGSPYDAGQRQDDPCP